MMVNNKFILVVAAAVAISGCAKKRPDVLPPAAGDTGALPGDGGFSDPNAGMSGLQDQFRQAVGNDTVNFGLDRYDVDGNARSILDRQADWLSQNPNVRVSIEGHADERGTREYNLALGDRRANSVSNYLSARGVSATRITTVSYGKERPVAMGSDEGSWAQNRRAVTVVIQ